MFGKILIANRGEIACRIQRTAREMGIRTVAVFVEADAGALFTRQAGEAWFLSSGSYLDGAAIIDIARQSGAEAIHPGYGFLSENAEFAAACEEASIVFIGPGQRALSTMGSKAAAKTLLQQSQIPLIPGYHGEEQSVQRLMEEAEQIGYPVLIKASAGGGGKGMRVVETAEAFAAALASCQREALSSFGETRVLIEKYLQSPRHVELQVFADQHDHCIYLFERDCSIQRRHQKVLEEAPAPGLPDELRQRMGQTACQVARAVDYQGAGTVEFILDSQTGLFYFMEMNTRLQVEHPVTEMITGQDLVAWQLQVAAGQALPVSQQDLKPSGHAIEVRLYAEDPERDFLPSCGRISHLRTPAESGWLRIDTGICQGDTITPLFDPMLAKLIVHGHDRAEAIARLEQTLQAVQLDGVSSNLGFLRKICQQPAFRAGHLDTGFIARHQASLLAGTPQAPGIGLALLALADTLASARDDGSAWTRLAGWRQGQASARHCWHYQQADGQTAEITVSQRRAACQIDQAGSSLQVSDFSWQDPQIRARIDGRWHEATLLRDGSKRTLFFQGDRYPLEWDDPLASAGDVHQHAGHLKSPMPGRIIRCCAEPGSPVSKGSPLLIMEAMKMEHTLYAPANGHVDRYYFQPGDQVAENVDLLDFIVQDVPND